MESANMIERKKYYNNEGVKLLRKCIEEEMRNPSMNKGRLYLL